MDANQERFIRVSIGLLARQVRSLVLCVGGINAVLQDSKALTVAQIELLNDIAKEMIELNASVSSLADQFPPEEPGSGDGRPTR